MRSGRYNVQYIRGSLVWVASGIVVFPGASSETYAPIWTLHIVGLSISLFLYVFDKELVGYLSV